eukprot:scaffold284365_cov26-Tisochrysis_lutea.AAC.2
MRRARRTPRAGAHLVESNEGDLVVEVVVKSIQSHLADEPEAADLGGGDGPLRRKAAALIVDGKWEREDEGDDGEHAVQVWRVCRPVGRDRL